MKSIKEKQLLVKWSRAMNEPIDPALVEEVERYEQLQKEIVESVKQNSIRDLVEASVVAEKFVEKIKIEFPKPPTLEEVLNVIKEETDELVQTQTVQEPPTPKSLAAITAEHITKEVKLEEKADSFQQPDPLVVNKNLNDITKKLKFLEQAIGKIASHGPGSGEVRFMNLDDVDRASFADRDTHKILRYKPNANPAFDSVYFDFLSGDQGPIYSMKYDVTGYTGNANVGPGLTYYDPERDTLEILHKDGTATYTGLDNYIRIANNGSGGEIKRGEFLVFTGVQSANLVPYVGKFVADSNAIPLYSVGVAANDISSNAIGRAIVLGELEDINASGNTSGEVWSAGDILWASPSQPGKLTNIQPTAPNVALSVAAVIDPDPTAGRLLVRPVIWPRLYYGSFVSTQPQTAANTTSAFAITLNKTEFASGFVIENNSRIKALNAGLYNIQFSIQFTSTNAAAKNIFIFPKKNGVSVPDSSTVFSITGNGTNLVPYLNYVISLNANDYVELFFGVSDTAAQIASPAVPAYSPNIPPVILTVTQVAL